MRNGIAARGLVVVGVAAALTVAAIGTANASPAPAANRTLSPQTQFYVDHQSKAVQQALTDLRAHDLANAKLMAELASWPESTWFNGNSTPAETRASVAALMKSAKAQHQVPVLVAYNIPGRDCSQYSAGVPPTRRATWRGSRASRPASETSRRSSSSNRTAWPCRRTSVAAPPRSRPTGTCR